MSAHKRNFTGRPAEGEGESAPGADFDIMLSGPDWDRVLESMERPPRTNPALKALLREYSEAVASGKLEVKPS